MLDSLDPKVLRLLICFVVLGLVALLSALVKATARPAIVAKPLLTAREQAMLEVLEQLFPNLRFHAQVAMGALLKVQSNVSRQAHASARNSFSQKIVDFVVQDKASGEVLALIEIDDRSHNADRDRSRDLMTANAGYRTIRIPKGARPTIADVSGIVSWLSAASVSDVTLELSGS